jgi:phage gp36-like protein
MSYCTQNGVTSGDIMPARISEAQLLNLTSETDVAQDIDQAVIDDAIESADAIIDSYCAVKYPVPFTDVPKRVKNLSADIATFNLFQKRSSSLGMPESVRQAYEDAISFLKDVSKGLASLGSEPAPGNTAVTTVKVKSNARVFTKDSLRSM